MTHTPTYQDANYRPSGLSNGYQEFNLFLPDTAATSKPSSGWPVVVFVNNSGYTASTRLSTAAGAHELLLHQGIAVCDATVTITDTGDPSITGGGMFWDPDVDASSWATDDVPEKDVGWIVQHLRDKSAAYGIDGSRIALVGQTYASAQLVLWVAFDTDRADSGASTTQEQQSTLPNAVFALTPLTYFEALLYSRTNNHLRDATTPSAKAATYGAASFLHRLGASPLFRIFSYKGEGQVRTLLWSIGNPTSTEFGVASTGAPVLSNALNSESDVWMTIMLERYARAQTYGSHLFHRNRMLSTTSTIGQAINFDRYVDAARIAGFASQWLQGALRHWRGVASFDVPIDWAMAISTTRASVQVKQGAAHRRTTQSSVSRAQTQRSVRAWEVGAREATLTEITSLRGYFDDAGPVLSIDFEPPSVSGTVPCRFVESSLIIEHVGADRYRWRAQLEEAI